MIDSRKNQPFYARKLYRIFSGSFGLILTCVGLYSLLFIGPSTIIHFFAGSAIIALGYNMVASACKAKESWLSKLGPLP